MLNRSIEQTFKEKYLAFEKCKRICEKGKAFSSLEILYIVFEWLLAKNFYYNVPNEAY